MFIFFKQVKSIKSKQNKQNKQKRKVKTLLTLLKYIETKNKHKNIETKVIKNFISTQFSNTLYNDGLEINDNEEDRGIVRTASRRAGPHHFQE